MKIIYKFKILFYKKILKRDTMELEVERYRKLGANIGKNMRAFSPITSAEPYLLEFGDNITVSEGVCFITHDNSAIKVIKNSTDIFGRIKIGDNCFIGRNSIILPGVQLSKNIIVGAGSVVTKSFREDGVIIAGNPAKVIGRIDDFNSSKYISRIFNNLDS